MANLYDPPPIRDLPLTRGRDLVVDFQQQIPVDDVLTYTPYGDGVTVSLIIDTDHDPVVAEAVIDGYHAIVRIESTVADIIPKGKLWRCRISTPASGEQTDDIVPVNGRTVRYDGRPPLTG